MPLKKSKRDTKVRIFNEFIEAKEVFENPNNPEEMRIEALDYILRRKEIFYVLKILSNLFQTNDDKNHIFIDYAFSNFEYHPKREEDFEMMFKMLKSDNAYLRNSAILFLQQYGVEVKSFIHKLMADNDRDIRIFAINILGDVKFEDSVDMLREFIKNETDINALMTAIDYMGEIGEYEDIELLETIKQKFNDDYITFGIDLAIDRIKN
jgi:HEAT repeat protein